MIMATININDRTKSGSRITMFSHTGSLFLCASVVATRWFLNESGSMSIMSTM
jgi:hypothetical protein